PARATSAPAGRSTATEGWDLWGRSCCRRHAISSFRTQPTPARLRTAPARAPHGSELFDSTFSWQVPRSHRLLHLFERRHIRSQSLAVSQLGRPITALGIQKIQQAGSPGLISVLADISRVLRLLEILRGVKLDDLIVA